MLLQVHVFCVWGYNSGMDSEINILGCNFIIPQWNTLEVILLTGNNILLKFLSNDKKYLLVSIIKKTFEKHPYRLTVRGS